MLGFYCDQFANQGGSYDQQCAVEQTYNVNFPVFGVINVNPPDEHPVFTWLKTQPKGSGAVPWNFTKWLINRDGEVLGRWEPSFTPAMLRETIEAAL